MEALEIYEYVTISKSIIKTMGENTELLVFQQQHGFKNNSTNGRPVKIQLGAKIALKRCILCKFKINAPIKVK